jgi:hypothetical protein
MARSFVLGRTTRGLLCLMLALLFDPEDWRDITMKCQKLASSD